VGGDGHTHHWRFRNVKIKIIVAVILLFSAFCAASLGFAIYGRSGVANSFSEIEDVSHLHDFLSNFPHQGPVYWHCRRSRYLFKSHGTLDPGTAQAWDREGSFTGWSKISNKHWKSGSGGSTYDIPHKRHDRVPFVPNDVQHSVNFMNAGDRYWHNTYDFDNSFIEVTVNLDTSEFELSTIRVQSE
jgi:hypothetical protein